ncbi:MAG: HlyD family efflux transporter periplasmic adaptor subunit [Alloprevotella sp.]|nr:HlyD family efflux transporter periplasmic adaptor subunit [Alloprevotella sp.]
MIRKAIFVVCALLLVAGCRKTEKAYDATGTFEATETTVYAEQNGALLSLQVTEGERYAAGQQVGLVDTAQVWLKLQQLASTKEVYASQRPDTQAQIAATREQLAKARLEQQRYSELVKDGAAPSKSLDDANNQVRVLQKQLEAQTSTLRQSTESLNKQIQTTDVQMRQLYDQLKKCRVMVPTDGVVIEKYVEQGEYVAMGKALFKMADTDHMFLRAYVTSAQLQQVKVGQEVEVFADYGSGQRQAYKGKVAWISSKSEFTPKTILTDDERADLVYAVKISVENDGFVKIGMYGEVKW